MTDMNEHPTDLLPFYANATLTGSELEKVSTHITGCKQCQNDLVLLKTMRAVSKQDAPAVAEDFAWHRLRRDIKQQNMQTINISRIWKTAFATAASLLILVQTVFIFKLDSDLDSYTQAGQQQQSAVVQIKFNPNAREEQIRTLLIELNAEFIAGPSAAGIYRVKLTQLRDDPAAEKKIAKLKDKKLLINYLTRE